MKIRPGMKLPLFPFIHTGTLDYQVGYKDGDNACLSRERQKRAPCCAIQFRAGCDSGHQAGHAAGQMAKRRADAGDTSRDMATIAAQKETADYKRGYKAGYEGRRRQEPIEGVSCCAQAFREGAATGYRDGYKVGYDADSKN